MSDIKSQVWRVPAYLPYLQPPLTDQCIASAEQEIGYKLPIELISLLRQQNGGYIRLELRDCAHRSISGIGPHFPSLTDFDWTDVQDHVSFDLQGLVPFDGDGHWFLCLDYRTDPDQPSITLADIELGEERQLAGSFASYLGMLQLPTEGKYVLQAIPDIDSTKESLARSLGVSFESPQAWAHGYPTERAQLPGRGGRNWLWISPNIVPRGFVREDHGRYDELRSLLPGTAERFPGLPPASYILTATDGILGQVLERAVGQ